jgi:hypothetical protein
MWESRRDFKRVWGSRHHGFPYSVISMAFFVRQILDERRRHPAQNANLPRNACRDQLSVSALAISRSFSRPRAKIGQIEEPKPFVVLIVSRINVRESRCRTAFLRAVIGSQITQNLRARFGVPSPCHQVTFRTEKGCADESTVGSQKRLKDGNAYHYGVRSSLPIC